MRIILPLVIILGLLIAGLWPQPFIQPDWRTPYEKALASGDCKAITRLHEILVIAGDGVGDMSIRRDMLKGQLCGVEPNEKMLSTLEHVLAWNEPNLIDRIVNTSFIGTRIQLARWDPPPTKNPVIQSAISHWKRSAISCWPSLTADILVNTDYELLRFSLNHDELDTQNFFDIATQKRSVCADQLMGYIKLMLSAAHTKDEFVFALQWLNRNKSFLKYSSPDLVYEILSMEKSIPAEAIKEVRHNIGQPSLNGILNPIVSSPESEFGCDDYVSRTLRGTLACATNAARSVPDNPVAAVVAFYYIQRAKRMGWTDLVDVERTATSNLSEECENAIREREAEDAPEDAIPRNFKSFGWRQYKLATGACKNLFDAYYAQLKAERAKTNNAESQK